MGKRTSVKRTETSVIELSSVEILTVLRRAGHEVPFDAKVTVTVPGGGDWSNTDLEIGGDTPLVITWVTTQES